MSVTFQQPDARDVLPKQQRARVRVMLSSALCRQKIRAVMHAQAQVFPMPPPLFFSAIAHSKP
jgi:hypothetical protein